MVLSSLIYLIFTSFALLLCPFFGMTFELTFIQGVVQFLFLKGTADAKEYLLHFFLPYSIGLSTPIFLCPYYGKLTLLCFLVIPLLLASFFIVGTIERRVSRRRRFFCYILAVPLIALMIKVGIAAYH